MLQPATARGLNDEPQPCPVQLLPAASDNSRYFGLDPADVEVTVLDKYGLFLPAIMKAARNN